MDKNKENGFRLVRKEGVQYKNKEVDVMEKESEL